MNNRQVQVEHVAGGWKRVLETFKSDHISAMGKFPKRYLLLLIDFDGEENRIAIAKREIPPDLIDRVFVLGVLSEPEILSKLVGQTEEEMGEQLAEACMNGVDGLWSDPLLKHNGGELKRMQSLICGHLRA